MPVRILRACGVPENKGHMTVQRFVSGSFLRSWAVTLARCIIAVRFFLTQAGFLLYALRACRIAQFIRAVAIMMSRALGTVHINRRVTPIVEHDGFAAGFPADSKIAFHTGVFPLCAVRAGRITYVIRAVCLLINIATIKVWGLALPPIATFISLPIRNWIGARTKIAYHDGFEAIIFKPPVTGDSKTVFRFYNRPLLSSRLFGCLGKAKELLSWS